MLWKKQKRNLYKRTTKIYKNKTLYKEDDKNIIKVVVMRTLTFF